jgi:hypothetical protein
MTTQWSVSQRPLPAIDDVPGPDIPICDIESFSFKVIKIAQTALSGGRSCKGGALLNGEPTWISSSALRTLSTTVVFLSA